MKNKTSLHWIIYLLVALFFVTGLKGYGQINKKYISKRDSLQIIINNNLVLYDKGKYGEVIRVSEELLPFLEKHEYPKLTADTYGILSAAYSLAGNNKKRFDYLHKSLELRIKIKDTNGIVISYNDMGTAYSLLDSLDLARSYYEKAIKLARKTKKNDFIIYPLHNMGNILVFDGEYKKSNAYLKEAIEIGENSEILKKRSVLSGIYLELALNYNELGNDSAYELNLEKGIQFSKENEYFEQLADFYDAKANVLYNKRKYRDAYIALDQYTKIVDTVSTIKEFKTTKQIEADNFLRENREKLVLANKEKELQAKIAQKSKTFNLILMFFILFLMASIFLVFKNNTKFKKEKDRAEKLAQAKSDFYAEISHELRTPLYAVIELSGLLARENVNKKHKVYLESLNFSGTHLLSLINNVLEMNKLESGTIKIEHLEFNLSTMLSNIVESVEYALNDSKNKLHLSYDEEIPDLLIGDSLKLAQVFINLISNAIKFTDRGNIYVCSKLLAQTDKDVTLFFEVKDDGIGIPLEKQSKIFENFYQENVKMEKTYKGTGLGLSIVKRFVMAMGSDVAITSEEGKGTAFGFELVFKKGETPLNEVNVEKSLTQEIKEMHFLVVDDNKINQLVTSKLLKQLGVKTTTLGSGEEAVEHVIDGHNFDCILMDINMPGLDGFQTTELIRKFEKEIPIIALTAASTEELKQKVLLFGMNSFIIKPFLKADFIETIHKVLIRKEDFSG